MSENRAGTPLLDESASDYPGWRVIIVPGVGVFVTSLLDGLYIRNLLKTFGGRISVVVAVRVIKISAVTLVAAGTYDVDTRLRDLWGNIRLHQPKWVPPPPALLGE